jgi:hypothetical protein
MRSATLQRDEKEKIGQVFHGTSKLTLQDERRESNLSRVVQHWGKRSALGNEKQVDSRCKKKNESD